MRKYIELVQKNGLDHAMQEFQIEMIEMFKKESMTATARALGLGRTTFFWRVQKLNLSHLFNKETEDTSHGNKKENQENNKEEI